MVKIDIISGFLGAGKTTLIKKLLDNLKDEKVVLIENEFGEIGIDGGFLKDSNIDIKEINSGCICCSLVGDFYSSLAELIEKYSPQRIIIEPSGVGKLSDVVAAVEKTLELGAKINIIATVVDALKVKMYSKNFGEFYNNQIESANTIILSRTDKIDESKLSSIVEILKEKNDDANIVTTHIDLIEGKKLIEIMEADHNIFEEEIKKHTEYCENDHECCHHHHDDEEEHECCHHHHDDEEEHECCHHHHDDEEEHECCHHHHDDEEEHECCHHHHDDEEEHECCHHHHDDEEEHECCHHHHDDEEEHECCHHHDEDHEHHHHYDENGNCSCGHHHHDADEIFVSLGIETVNSFSYERLESILKEASTNTNIIRLKGMVSSDNKVDWYHFDLVPGEYEIRKGSPEYTGKICVIAANITKKELQEMFSNLK